MAVCCDCLVSLTHDSRSFSSIESNNWPNVLDGKWDNVSENKQKTVSAIVFLWLLVIIITIIFPITIITSDLSERKKFYSPE